MKNILERFDIELSEKTERRIKKQADMEYEDFINNGDYENDKMPAEMSVDEIFKYAYHEGYRSAMLDVLMEDAEQSDSII